MIKMVRILRNVSFTAVIVAAIFKVMHLQGADLVLLFSLSMMFLYFALRYFFKTRLLWQDHIYFLMSTCVLSYILALLLSYPDIVVIVGVSIALLIFILTLLFKKNTPIEEGIGDEGMPSFSVLGVIPLSLLIIGAALRILHYPGSGIFIILAFATQIAHILLGMSSKKRNNNKWDDILDSDEELRDGANRKIE